MKTSSMPDNAAQSRIGVEFETIGPEAECNSVPNPIWLKSKWCVEEVWTIARHGSPLVIGAPPIFQWPRFPQILLVRIAW